jgi:hypothetical protein
MVRPQRPSVTWSHRMRLINEENDNSHVQAVLTALRGMYVNGGVVFAVFAVQSVKEYPNAQDELRAFLDSPVVRRTLHYLKIPEGLTPLPSHTLISPTTLQSDIKSMLRQGGAYTRGCNENADKLAASFCGCLLGDRIDIKLFRIDGAWTPWFYDVAWDYTCIMKLASQERWVVFCCTDTD